MKIIDTLNNLQTSVILRLYTKHSFTRIRKAIQLWSLQVCLRFTRIRKAIQLWSLQVCLNAIHLFEDKNRNIWGLTLAHDLFLGLLSSFHRRGRTYQIRPVKMFEKASSLLYTMIVKSLIDCWCKAGQDRAKSQEVFSSMALE